MSQLLTSYYFNYISLKVSFSALTSDASYEPSLVSASSSSSWVIVFGGSISYFGLCGFLGS